MSGGGSGSPGLQISIDATRCIGAGQCVRVAPKLFAQDETTGLVVLLEAAPGHDQEAAAKDAAQLCPAGVIGLRQSKS
jgi:ferredoxin